MSARPLSPAELRAFQSLGLTPGHWAALAPVPLFRGDLRTAERHEVRYFHDLRSLLRTGEGQGGEAENFWVRIARQVAHAPRGEYDRDWGTALQLLGWHLAADRQRPRREEYLGELYRQAGRFLKRATEQDTPLRVVAAVRTWVEAYLGLPEFDPEAAEPIVEPPEPAEVTRLLGPDFWKQTLSAPLVAAVTERNMHASDVFPLIRRLAYVTERGLGVTPEPLEPHLVPGWLALFGGLFDPSRPAPDLEAALRVAVRGLASMRNVAEREKILQALGKEVGRTVLGADRERYAAGWVDRLREWVEDVIRSARPAIPERPPEPTPPAQCKPAEPASAPVPADVVTPQMPPREPGVLVREANPFTMVSLDEALVTARAVSVADIRAWLEKPENARGLLFDDQRTDCPEVAVVRDPELVPPALWVVGDVHADILTLANIVAHAERVAQAEGQPPAFLFLGDFVDRGGHDHETLLFLFGLILKDPRRVCVLPGNHDIDLRWDEKKSRFVVTIEPAEYCERLNGLLGSAGPGDAEQIELAKLLIPFWSSRPKALFLPDGTLYAHAGFPHTDTHELLRDVTDLARPPCLSDFLWARIAERPKKRPNRGNRGHEFGWNDFADFCKLSARLGVPPVRRLVRGHDHVTDRWQFFPDYAAHPVLTVNAMGRRMEGEPASDDRQHPHPVMARHVPGQLPEVIQLPLDAAEVDRAFGREQPKESAGDEPEPGFDEIPGGPQVDGPQLPTRPERVADPRAGSGP